MCAECVRLRARRAHRQNRASYAGPLRAGACSMFADRFNRRRRRRFQTAAGRSNAAAAVGDTARIHVNSMRRDWWGKRASM